MNKKKKIGFNVFEVIIIIIISSVVSIIATGVITTNNNSTTSGTSYSEILKDENIRSFLDTYSSVVNNYYKDIDKSKIVDSAIDGMLKYLNDKYSIYMDSESTDALNDKLDGKYKGIGVSITEEKIINDVFDDSPAMKAGIEIGDKIIEANNIDVKEKTSSEVISILNENPDDIKIKVLRGDEEKLFNLKMDEVSKPVISYGNIEHNNKNIGYIYIESFSKTLTNQVDKALKRLESDNKIEGLIIDLRRNTGGYLNVAQDTSSLFLEKGKLVYSLETKNSSFKYIDETDEKRSYPIVVIIDETTASAAEVLTAALKDSYGAKIVGITSYGKGLVQQTKDLNDGTMVKYSTAKWFRPNGECVEGVGINPDYEIKEDTKSEVKTTDNIFIDKALEVLFQ